MTNGTKSTGSGSPVVPGGLRGTVPMAVGVPSAGPV